MAFVAILAISAIASATASAELPEFSPAKNVIKESVGGKATFEQKEGIAPVSCTSSKGTGEITGAKVGKFDELYLGCTAPLAGKCTGLNDKTAGSILVKGVTDLRYITKKTDVALIFLIEPVHFECEKLIELVEVTGCVVGLVTPLNTKTKTFTVKLKGTKGVQDVTEVLNEKNTANESCKLESEINGGAKKQSSQTQEDTISPEKEGEIIA
jgi:hypothetical protein